MYNMQDDITSEKLSSDSLEMGTFFGKLESSKRISSFISPFLNVFTPMEMWKTEDRRSPKKINT